ncbi:MAG: hypothetical protein ABW221_15545 [Vicinamibacteria bacterium]
MGTRTLNAGGLLIAAALAVPAVADEWDIGTGNDNDFNFTTNTLFHGSEQVHDLAGSGGVADVDWYRVPSDQFASYQFVVDGTSGDLSLTSSPAKLQRIAPDGVTVAESATVGNFGRVMWLNWLGAGPGILTSQLFNIRVQGAFCGGNCDPQDRYRARLYETTYTVPRFNNAGSQSTVLFVQNATDRICSVTVHFFDAAGGLIGTRPASTVNPRQLIVANTAATVPNQSGSARVVHTCGYGGLMGKAVSLEPSTGFTFDTALLHRPN